MDNNYVFKSTDTIVRHIVHRQGGYSGVRTHKTIYFLFALYAGQLGIHDENPDYLFEEDFEAWKFGPVLRSLYLDSVEGDVKGIEWVPQTSAEEDFYEFVEEVLASVNKLGDFQLVDRTHEDKAWKNAYIESDSGHEIGIMNKEDIKNDYVN